MRGLALLLIAAAPLFAEDAAGIMERVGRNQERAEKLRSVYLFQQDVQIRLHRGGRKLAREERHRFTVAPGPNGISKERVSFAGRYTDGGKTVEYDRPGYKYKGLDIDAEIAGDLVDELTADKSSRDGLAADLFPLTPEQQRKYKFRFEGPQSYAGREVFRITFKPKTRESASWAGEALIDAAAYEPVLITTWLARGVPMAVRVLLGTNLKHLGFKVAYQQVDDGAWFPVSYGGEFQLKALFFYKRTISISMRNEEFRRADISSYITYDLR
ncbi:MAG TPA: hypothetical protein VN428_07940 [Bryobacteraceae bacterium]|nr:hypothetical protein [Bryobacteraceae bacterium]